MMELKLTTQFKKDLKRCKHNEDLIWIDKMKPLIKLLRLGSHSELYGKWRKMRKGHVVNSLFTNTFF